MALFSEGRRTSLPLLREVAVDFTLGQPILEGNGEVRYVTGREAVRVWVWRALQPDNVRFLYSAHTDSYGNQLARLAGSALPEAESRIAGMVREVLGVCPYILSVDRFSFTREESRLIAAFTVHTVYGDVPAESEMWDEE